MLYNKHINIQYNTTRTDIDGTGEGAGLPYSAVYRHTVLFLAQPGRHCYDIGVVEQHHARQPAHINKVKKQVNMVIHVDQTYAYMNAANSAQPIAVIIYYKKAQFHTHGCAKISCDHSAKVNTSHYSIPTPK